MEYLCLTCGKDKGALGFSLWLKDVTKARRCNSCLNSPEVNERVESEKKARKKGKTPMLEGLAQTKLAKNKREIKKKLDDLAYERELKNEVDYL